MKHTELFNGSALRRTLNWLAALALLCTATPAIAAPSGSAGSGIWDVPSAESKRAGNLSLGFFASYRTIGLRDSLDTHFNDFRGGAHAIFGIPGGFEVSGTLPLFADYITLDKGSSPFGEDLDLRYGDLTGRLRWTTPFLMPGLRWGLEGEVAFPTGNDDVVMLPTRGAVKPYTGSETNYAVRSMWTWDARGSSSAQALRLHAGAGYHFQGDESRYFSAMTALPLDLPAPMDEKANDFLSVFTAAELDLSRVTLYGELSTEQYVNQRGLIRGKENRVTLTPGLRFWIPGGMSLSAAYSMNFSEDDASTSFDPGRAFSENQLRVSLSLGTIYRNARAKQEAIASGESAPAPAVVAMPVASAIEKDSVKAVPTPKKTVAVEDRHETQDDQRPAAVAKASPATPAAADSAVRKVTKTVEKVKAVAAPIPAPAADAAIKYADTDGDGIPDSQDHCPLLPEDFDGFQDTDGCPDLDNDRDGILDVNDACPNDPETYNGYYDFDGCPDELPADRSSAAPKLSATSGSSAPAPAAVSGKLPPPAPAGAAAAKAVVPSADRMAADSLRVAIAAERVRNTELTDRLARMETSLESLSASMNAKSAPVVTPAPSQPVAAPTPSVAPALAVPRPAALTLDTATTARELQMRSELEAQRQRSADLEARIRALEPAGRSALPAETQPQNPPATMIIQSESTPMSVQNSDKLRALESEMTTLRATAAAQAALTAATAASQAKPAKPAAKAVADTTGRAILERLSAIQAAMDSMAAAKPAAPAPVMTPSEPVVDATRTLDLMLPMGVARVFPEIQFPTAASTLEGPALGAIESIAGVLRLVPEARVEVVGHTDNLGRTRTNMMLSRERARSVADALVSRGVAQSQLTVLGRGDSSPIASNGTVEGRQANRRVEFTRTR